MTSMSRWREKPIWSMTSLELDHTRRERFLANLNPYSQAFFLPPEKFHSASCRANALLYTVRKVCTWPG